MVREYTERKGKYARPNLALLWCELYGGKTGDAFLSACAIQLVEDWVLIHDDWEDQNELRRGKPAAHILYGDVFAINAGDAGQMIQWKIVHDAAKAPGVGERIYEKFYDIMLVLAEGQYYDLKLAAQKDITGFTLDDYWRSIHAKSAYYSVYGPMQLGAIAAGQTEEVVKKIEDYGVPIGRAFQVKDDILDCISTKEVLGKSIGTDIYEGTKTAILWHFVQNASPAELEEVRAIYAKDRKDKTQEEIARVIKLFEEVGSIKFAQELVDELAREALEKFEERTKDIPESEIKKTARDAILKMAARRK
jgi:geranylgeranyl pyrophosphate synthase